LKLVKSVVNNDGGTKTAANWNLTATAAAPDAGRNFGSQTATPVFHDVFGGVEYTLAESPSPGAGYSSTGVWSWDGGTLVAPNKGTVALGAHVTCTIVNTDDPTKLKLVKDVQNDDGGTKTAADWNLTATAPVPDAARNFASQTATPVFHDIFAGAVYTLAETPSPGAGYSSTGQWSCDGGAMNAAKTTVTVPLGAQV